VEGEKFALLFYC